MAPLGSRAAAGWPLAHPNWRNARRRRAVLWSGTLAALSDLGPEAAHTSNGTPTASSVLLNSDPAAVHALAHVTVSTPSASAPGSYPVTIHYVHGQRAGKIVIPDVGLLPLSKMQENLKPLEYSDNEASNKECCNVRLTKAIFGSASTWIPSRLSIVGSNYSWIAHQLHSGTTP